MNKKFATEGVERTIIHVLKSSCTLNIHSIPDAFTLLATTPSRFSPRSSREGRLTPNRDLLPINSQFPQLHSRLDDGRLSPASVPLGAAAIRDLDDSFDSPSFIYDLDSLDTTCHPHAQRAASAVVVSRAFLVLLNDPDTTPTGRARLLDGSNAKGPFTWLRRLPVPSGDPCDTPFFAFQIPDHFPVALALDLLLLPPTHEGVGTTSHLAAPPAPPSPNP